MRVDPNYSSGLLSALNQTSATEGTLTDELSSGLRVGTLSADAGAAAANVAIASSINGADSFVQSSTREQSLLQATDNALSEVVSQTTAALSLAVSAGDATLSSADLAGISQQVGQIRDNVVALGNSNYLGVYLFAGSQGTTKPFAVDTSTNPATATYAGDSVTRKTVTPDGSQIAISVSGADVFLLAGGSLLGTLNKLVSDLSAGKTDSVQADSSALTAALGQVTGQRAVIDRSLNRLTGATSYATTQETVMKAQQSALLSADPAQVATDLKSAEVQQQALLGITSALNAAPNLFSYLK